jgi:transposase
VVRRVCVAWWGCGFSTAALQDRDGGRLVLDRAKMKMPSIVLIWADGGYAGKLIAFAHHHFRILVEIIRRTDKRPTFEVVPRRWVIERTNSWLMRTRRLAREYERLPEHSEAMVKSTMIGLMTRRLAPGPGRPPWRPNQTPEPTS